MVHPLLSAHLHPMCKDVIARFKACHQDHPYAKFWGRCNDLRAELDRCLNDEVRINVSIQPSTFRCYHQIMLQRTRYKRRYGKISPFSIILTQFTNSYVVECLPIIWYMIKQYMDKYEKRKVQNKEQMKRRAVWLKEMEQKRAEGAAARAASQQS